MVDDTRAGEVTIENINGRGLLGVVYAADTEGSGAIIANWERLDNGKFGPVQKHGGVHIGDALYAINDIIVSQLPFNNVIGVLNNQPLITKLKYISSTEHYRRKRGVSRPLNSLLSDSSQPVFQSVIRQYHISTDPNRKDAKFTEYEIACQFRMTNKTRLETNRLLKWTIWRRYSEFEKLHNAIVLEYGWQVEGLEFPSPHTFIWDKFSVPFLEQRREEMNVYWLKLLEVPRITDFHHRQHCSGELLSFLEVTDALSRAPDPVPPPVKERRQPSQPAPRTSTSTSTSASPLSQSVSVSVPISVSGSLPTSSSVSNDRNTKQSEHRLHNSSSNQQYQQLPERRSSSSVPAPSGASSDVLSVKSNVLSQIRAKRKD